MQPRPPLSREEILDEIIQNYGLKPQHIYLLDLIPLIELIWIDGKAQDAEISLLYGYVIRHLANLSNEIGGAAVVSDDEVNAFLDRFLAERPDPALLAGLRKLALTLSQQHSDRDLLDKRKDDLLNLCMDIAAAAVVQYPYDKHERIMASEKRLLIEIITALSIASGGSAT